MRLLTLHVLLHVLGLSERVLLHHLARKWKLLLGVERPTLTVMAALLELRVKVGIAHVPAQVFMFVN